jgi:hypothetical protein
MKVGQEIINYILISKSVNAFWSQGSLEINKYVIPETVSKWYIHEFKW